MANRSDRASALPRQLKRMITMGVARGYITPGEDENAVRKLFIKAHEHAKDVRNKRTVKDATLPGAAALPADAGGEGTTV